MNRDKNVEKHCRTCMLFYFQPNKPMGWDQRLQINLVRVHWIELTTNLAPPSLCRCHKPESAPVLQKVTM